MTAKRKARILDITGAVISAAVPSVAAILEFPQVKAETNVSGEPFYSFLNLSAAAFAIIAIITVITAWRFFRDRINMPRSGLFPSLALFFVSYGVEQFIHSFTVVMLWASVGCAVGWICYIVADKIRPTETQKTA